MTLQRACTQMCTLMSQHLFKVQACTCMVLRTPVWMHAYSPQKMHMHPCMHAYATVQKHLCHGNYCERIVSLVRASCRLSFAARPVAVSTKSVTRNQSPDAVRSRNQSKSTLAHDTVAAAVSLKHHSIIHVGAGLIQFVYDSHSKRGHGAHPIQNSTFTIFRANLFFSCKAARGDWSWGQDLMKLHL